jgi:hypothetical protein
MRRFVRAVLPAALSLALACQPPTLWSRPSRVSHVPDGARVRVSSARDEPRVEGRSFAWQRGSPRVITATGDTILVPSGAALEIQLDKRTKRARTGGVIGGLVGLGVTWARCPELKKRCRQNDPTPVLTIGLGALVGYAIKRNPWVSVAWE